jgi:ribose transport system permease protein
MTTSSFSNNWLRRTLRKVKIPPVYIFLIIIFLLGGSLDQLFADGQIFTNQKILINIIVRSVALGIVAVGQTFVIIGGSIDLSVVYVISLTSVISSYMMQGETSNVPKAILMVFLIGAVIGFVNGVIITKLQINPFIATLGTSLIIRGIINSTFTNYIFGSVPKSFTFFGYSMVGPIPISIIVLFLIVLSGWVLLSRTKFGAHLYSVGGNSEVARLSGLRTDWIVIYSHIICSMTAVLTGLFLVSRMQSGSPWAGQDGLYDLESIATTVIGGTALSGGKGGVWGTLAGVLIFGFLDTLFNQLGINPYLKNVLRGAIIILAVATYTYYSKKEVG